MESYFYYHFSFVVLLISCLVMLLPTRNKYLMFTFGERSTFLLMIIVSIILGSLPIKEIYSDRFLYAQLISAAHNNILAKPDSDLFFYYYIKFAGSILSPSAWMYLTAFIYTFNNFVFSKKIGGSYLYPVFLMFITGFFFYAYGVNTIRAGLAISFLLLALAYYDKLIYFVIFLLIAINIHFSMIIPVTAILLSKYFCKTRLYLFVWLMSIPLSAAMGHSFENFFASMSSDYRISYLSVDPDQTHYNIGFRIDFILYSCIPVFMGYYYIFKREIRDNLYLILYNTYILANCFWILVIRANFSDRFGYLSWFIYPAVLIYPALKYKLWDNQNQKITLIIFLHGLFTYIMFLK